MRGDRESEKGNSPIHRRLLRKHGNLAETVARDTKVAGGRVNNNW